MKKLLLLVTAVALGSALVGCGAKTEESSAAPATGIKDKTPVDKEE